MGPGGIERSEWALSPYQVWGPLDHPNTFIKAPKVSMVLLKKKKCSRFVGPVHVYGCKPHESGVIQGFPLFGPFRWICSGPHAGCTPCAHTADHLCVHVPLFMTLYSWNLDDVPIFWVSEMVLGLSFLRLVDFFKYGRLNSYFISEIIWSWWRSGFYIRMFIFYIWFAHPAWWANGNFLIRRS